MNEQVIGLGDVVTMGAGLECTVSQVHKDGTVDLFRVYTHTADFSYAGRQDGSSAVICYIGTENILGVNTKNLKLVSKGKELR